MSDDQPTIDLFGALADGDLDTAAILLDTGVDPHRLHPLLGTSCLQAAWDGSGVNGVRLLTEHGVDPSPVLLSVALNDEPDSLTELIRAGARPDIVDAEGWTALHHAAAYGYLASARVLLGAGVDRTLRTSSGLTAADLALRNHHFEVVSLLA